MTRFDRICATDIGTGCQQSRNIAQCLNMPGQWLLFGDLGQMSHLFDMGGPIDAPEQLPAGSVNSTEYRCGPWHLNNGAGQPIPAQSIVSRTP